MHLDDETIQRLLEPEASATLARSAQEHLASCADCRARLTEASREEAWVFERLRQLDHPVPQISAQSIMTSSRRQVPAWQRLAAGIVLAVGMAGIAYATPGSPLPRLVSRAIELIAPAPATPGMSPEPQPPAPAGIALPPGERLTIAFESEGNRDTAVVLLTEGNEVVVKALGGTTTFDSEATRLLIRHSGAPARFEISIPRTAASVELKVGEHAVLMKREARVTADVAPDSTGRYLIPLSRAVEDGDKRER
jgi:hypothetical protein